MERLFSKKHIWIKKESEKNVVLGLTPYALEQLGSIMFVNLPDVGDTIEMEKAFGDVESIKTVSDLIAPVSGVIIQINEVLMDEPEKMNKDALENWLVRVEITEMDVNLMNKEAYHKFLQEQ